VQVEGNGGQLSSLTDEEDTSIHPGRYALTKNATCLSYMHMHGWSLIITHASELVQLPPLAPVEADTPRFVISIKTAKPTISSFGSFQSDNTSLPQAHYAGGLTGSVKGSRYRSDAEGISMLKWHRSGCEDRHPSVYWRILSKCPNAGTA
jgi:hypothetical protein